MQRMTDGVSDRIRSKRRGAASEYRLSIGETLRRGEGAEKHWSVNSILGFDFGILEFSAFPPRLSVSAVMFWFLQIVDAPSGNISPCLSIGCRAAWAFRPQPLGILGSSRRLA